MKIYTLSAQPGRSVHCKTLCRNNEAAILCLSSRLSGGWQIFDLRDMELLTALQRHRHFAHAAEECGISQPAFSARISNLERHFGIAIVNRGNRFQGFTAEGEIALKWAHRLLQDADGLRQEMTAARGNLSGRLVIGVIPTALTFAARVPAMIREKHPELLIDIRSATSDEIRRDLGNYRIGAGISYIDASIEKALRVDVLYEEDYRLIMAEGMSDATGSISWRDAARLPLCLLSRTMQNRRIIEAVFSEIGVKPNTVMETNSLTAALVQLEGGNAATIIPGQMVDRLPISRSLKVLRLTDPDITRTVGLLMPERDPEPPANRVLADALLELAR